MIKSKRSEGINESCLEFLLIELIEVMKELSDEDINSSKKVDLNQDLEMIGFRVGQGLMEKYVYCLKFVLDR